MNTENDDLSEHEKQLGHIIFVYLKALEQGQTPNQEEWIAAYPQFTKELQEFFASKATIQRDTEPPRPIAEAAQLYPDSQPTTAERFFLAMCHHKLGVPKKARVCCDQVLAWWHMAN